MSDPGSITLAGQLLFTGAAFLLLYLVGHAFLLPLRRIRGDPCTGLDRVQKAHLRVLVGMAVVVVYLLLLAVFAVPFPVKCLGLLTATAGSLAVHYRHRPRRLAALGALRLTRDDANLGLLVLAVLVLTATLSANLVAGYHGSTNDDGAFHSFIVRLLLDSPQALWTRATQPYAAYIQTYPMGVHALAAFLATVLRVPVHQIILMCCAVMPTLIALASYSTLKTLTRNRTLAAVGLISAALLTLSRSWGPLSFSGLPLLTSFYLSIGGMGVLYQLVERGPLHWSTAALLALVVSLGLQTYPVTLLLLVAWAALLLLRGAWTANRAGRLRASLTPRTVLPTVVGLLLVLAVNLPYLTVVARHSTPALQHYPSDVDFTALEEGRAFYVDLVKNQTSFNWLLDLPALTAFFGQYGAILQLTPYMALWIPILYLASRLRLAATTRLSRAMTLVYLHLLSLLAFLTVATHTSLGPLTNGLVDPERVWQHLFVPALLLASTCLFLCLSTASAVTTRVLLRRPMNPRRRLVPTLTVVAVVAVVACLSLVTVHGLAVEAHAGYRELAFYLDRYSALDADDVALLRWIREHTPPDATILVTAADSGQYLTAISQRITVYSYDPRLYSAKYLRLVTLLNEDPRSRALPSLLQAYNVTYVYVGSRATHHSSEPFRVRFDPVALCSSEFFTPVQHLGGAWCFRVVSD